MQYIKNGFHVHAIHALLQLWTHNTFLAATVSIKLYSLNYFFWFGHHYTYLKRHNWVKQFIRFTDTGHIASFLLLLPGLQPFLPVAHNVHFIIMIGYWAGKLLFGLKDADRLVTPGLVEWHLDLCTYIHHTLPYLMIHYFAATQDQTAEYNGQTLLWTYAWLYAWFTLIYLPWRIYTRDPVYSILDQKQTTPMTMALFVLFVHVLVALSNYVGYGLHALQHP